MRDQVRERGGFDDVAVAEDMGVMGYTGRHRQVVGDEQQGRGEAVEQVGDLGLDGHGEGGGGE